MENKARRRWNNRGGSNYKNNKKNSKHERGEFIENNKIVKEIRETYPNESIDFISQKIIEKLSPEYNEYSYHRDISQEFQVELSEHQRIMQFYRVIECASTCADQYCINYHFPREQKRRAPKRLANGL